MDDYDISYETIVLDDDDERMKFYANINKEERPKKKVNTVPQIYINGERYNGYNELLRLLRPRYNHEKLHELTKMVTYNLNRVIDVNFYPTEKTHTSNKLHRPIGIGIQGLADTFAIMEYSFDDDEARTLNKEIFETIYHASLEASCEIAEQRKVAMNELHQQSGFWTYGSSYEDSGEYTCDDEIILSKLNYYKPTPEEMNLPSEHKGAYSSFEGSPLSEGIFQFDMWNVTPTERYNWEELKMRVKKHGTRNSLLLAPIYCFYKSNSRK